MYRTQCHCGDVRVEVERAPQKLTQCNCSICRRYGALWSYHRRRTVTVTGARSRLSAYSWGKGTREYYHCRRCGCVTHYEHAKKRDDGTDIVAVNARNSEEPVQVAVLPIKVFDGASSWRVVEERVDPLLLTSPDRES